ncbi:MAG: hypothetical protein M3Y73_11915 [Actinomycetota bacterium]|nr:hypothetical protein [Actinomycetota bacterium]
MVKFVQRRADPDRAEDVVADAFLVVWRRLDDAPHEQDAARAWVFGITRNILLNERRGGGCQMVCVSGGSDVEGVHYDHDR